MGLPTQHTDCSVLIVEDDEDIRETLVEILEDEGYLAFGAANGAEALAIVQQWRPDVILLDLMMPVMNGWQFVDTYGGLTETDAARAPIIVITAAGPGAVRSTKSMGAISAVLSKPIDVDVLLEVVGYHVAQH